MVARIRLRLLTTCVSLYIILSSCILMFTKGEGSVGLSVWRTPLL